MVFATYAESDEQLRHCLCFAESLRRFGGRYQLAPIWIYHPEQFDPSATGLAEQLLSLGADLRTSHAPEDAAWFYLSGKVFAAARAEKAATGESAVLVWFDEDTIVLREPVDFDLADSIVLAYRPVMHNRSGSRASEEPCKFWARVYDKLSIKQESLWSMVTPADQETIRTYFNAGLLVVRPEQEILRTWAEDFQTLYRDEELALMCRNEITWRIFIHQAALVGAVNHLTQHQTVELSEDYNYPIFFHQQFGAKQPFESLEEVVTLRYDIYFRDPDPAWAEKLQGDSAMIAWLKERLGTDR